MFTQLERGSNLPEHICINCVQDLVVAYRFRTNCESSDNILKSFVTVTTPNDSTKNIKDDKNGLINNPTLCNDEPAETSSSSKDIPTIVENSLKHEFLSIAEYDKILQNGDDDDYQQEETDPVSDDYDSENVKSIVDEDPSEELVEYIEEPMQLVYTLDQSDVNDEVVS